MDEKIIAAQAAIGADDLMTAINLLMDVHNERLTLEQKAIEEQKPLVAWEVTRNRDAYVTHYATVMARSREEAKKILWNKGDTLFDLNEEGDVRTFDDVEYVVEGPS